MLRVVGISYHTAPLALREKLAVSSEEHPAMLREIASCPRTGEAASGPGTREVAILATCNRTELYLVDDVPPGRDEAAWQFFARRGLESDQASLLYSKEGQQCVRHLFAVACGLDSPVLGETQVLGQVKGALAQAREAGTAGPVITALFSRAVAAAGRVHSRTGLGSHACSASSAAVEAISQELGSLRGSRILLVGAGKMAELAGRALRGRGAEVMVTSRSLGRASALAEKHGFSVLPWADLELGLASADAVICGTAAPHVILGADRMARAVAARGGRPLVVADLAMPRDVDPGVTRLPGVSLHDLDQLQARARANLEHRRALAGQAQALIEEEARRFCQWLAGRQAAPLIGAVRRRYLNMARGEVERALARMGPLSPEQRQVLEEMVRRLVNKGLHGPIKAMCRLAGDEGDALQLRLLADALLTPGTREARGGTGRGRILD